MGRGWKDTKGERPDEKFLKLLRKHGMIFNGMGPTSHTKWLIESVVAEGWNMIICGPTGIGKSTFAIVQALHLLSGKPWLGYPVKRVGKILIFQSENPADVMLERIQMARMKIWLSEKEVTERLIVTDKNQKFDVEKYHDRIRIIELAKKFGAEVLIFDSLKKFHNRNENDPSEMNAVMDCFDQIRSKLSPNVAIIVIHHDGHQGYERGATSIRAWCDVMIGLKGKPGKSLTLTFRKTRALDWPDDITLFRTDYTFIKKSDKKNVELPVKTILTKNYKKGCKKTELRDRLMKETGCSRRKADEAIRISLESNEIHERKEGRYKILYT
jgi:RecA-family ATPase